MLKSIYNHSPVFIQNTLISLYGIKLRKQRYGNTYKKEIQTLKNNYSLSESKIKQLQSDLLINTLKHAYNTVPYYKQKFSDLKININNLSLENFANHIPILDKDTLRENSDAFVSTDPSLGKFNNIHTSGTSGTPLNIRTNADTTQKNYAFFARMLDIAGVEAGQASATFAGRTIIPANQTRPPYWRHNYFMNNTLFSSYNISADTAPDYINELQRLQLDFIDSYPSAIYEIAHYINEHKIKHNIRPKAIITSSETLLGYQRREIESAFNTTIYDHYGCAEMAALITQCRLGQYHINPDFSYIEILDDELNPVKENESGHLVCTSFVNKCMPLIRYKIGDNAVFTSEKCACGCVFPLIKSLEGRTDDLIVTTEGKKVGRLDPVFKGLSGIKETQIIQESLNRLTVKLVVTTNFNKGLESQLAQNIQQRVGKEMSIIFDYVDQVPRTTSGKFKSVVSNIAFNK